MANPLKDKWILVTRPACQNLHLCHLLQQLSATVVAFPTIEIKPITIEKQRLQLNQVDVLIFTSANAVNTSIDFIQSQWPKLPTQLQFVAIGAGTQKALTRHHLPCHIKPEKAFSSEALLALDFFQLIANKNILIITGKNGRTLLKDTLVKRGAQVQTAYSYERKVPNYSASVIIETCDKDYDFMVCTSNASLVNLVQILGEKRLHQLLNAQIIGFSERIKPVAHQYGFVKTPMITLLPSDEAIVATIRDN